MTRCENIGYLVILAGALLALTVWFVDDYKSCSYPFGYIRVAFVAICMSLRLSSEISDLFMFFKIVAILFSL